MSWSTESGIGDESGFLFGLALTDTVSIYYCHGGHLGIWASGHLFAACPHCNPVYVYSISLHPRIPPGDMEEIWLSFL